MAMATVERAEGRGPWGFQRTLRVLVLFPVLWHTVPSAASLEVKMAGTQRVSVNDNATIACNFSSPQQWDIRIMGIAWFWKSPVNGTDVKVFQLIGSHQQAFRSGAIVPSPERLRIGDASLQLPGVQLREAGEYRCEVVITPEKAQGTVKLQVVASPVNILFQDPATVKNNEDIHFFLESSWFYPEEINIKWYKWSQEDHVYVKISKDIITDSAVKNEDGTFNITSHLRLKSSLNPNVTGYQCVVEHISLPNPWRSNFTLPAIAESKKSTSLPIVISCVVGIGLFLCPCLWKM